MNALEEKIRTALRETGEEVAPDSVPPLRLHGTRRRNAERQPLSTEDRT